MLMTIQYCDAGVTPSFTVQAVGPVTDFGELVCDSIRQFLVHKQQQQQQQQQQQLQLQQQQPVQSACLWNSLPSLLHLSPHFAVVLNPISSLFLIDFRA